MDNDDGTRRANCALRAACREPFHRYEIVGAVADWSWRREADEEVAVPLFRCFDSNGEFLGGPGEFCDALSGVCVRFLVAGQSVYCLTLVADGDRWRLGIGGVRNRWQ